MQGIVRAVILHEKKALRTTLTNSTALNNVCTCVTGVRPELNARGIQNALKSPEKKSTGFKLKTYCRNWKHKVVFWFSVKKFILKKELGGVQNFLKLFLLRNFFSWPKIVLLKEPLLLF